jgi:hypothetical protein
MGFTICRVIGHVPTEIYDRANAIKKADIVCIGCAQSVDVAPPGFSG